MNGKSDELTFNFWFLVKAEQWNIEDWKVEIGLLTLTPPLTTPQRGQGRGRVWNLKLHAEGVVEH